MQQHLLCDGKFPKNWSSYLRNAANKTELFQYRSGVIAHDKGKVVFTTLDKTVHRNPCADDDMIQSEYSLSPCDHEEFDARVMLHAANVASQGKKRILIITNDTDVAVLAIFFFTEIGAEKLWVTFGKSKKIRYISMHDICSAKSPAKTHALPSFHALTACDHTSFFFWNRKEISISHVDHKTRTHNSIVPPDGKVPRTPTRGYQCL